MPNTLDPKVRFLWLDVETTGLEPSDDLLLEVACWPSRSCDPLDLDPADAQKWVVYHDGASLGGALSEFTWRMHTANGLLPEVVSEKTAHELPGLEETLASVIGIGRSVFRSRESKCVNEWKLAGNSVHFDRGFLKADMRDFVRLLSHQHLDVTSLLLAARSLGAAIPKREPAHRAMDDVKQSIELYCEVVDFFTGKGPFEGVPPNIGEILAGVG